jgi:phenylacetate-CoA ligase
MANAAGWADHLQGIDPAALTSRQALASLPVLRKGTLKDRQAKSPPFGAFATSVAGTLARIFMSPGPIFEPEGFGEDWWRSARALFAAGFRKGDIVHNTFAYHLTPGGWILDSGARALGCAVIAAGPGNTEQQLDAIQYLKPTAYVGVPDYLKILLDKAKEAGRDASSFKKALVSGGALFPSLRAEYKQRGIDTYQTYATADLGIIAYESLALDGMIIDEGVIVEIVRPGTGDPVPPGEVGEVVVTAFNRDYPMIRLATGDMSAVLPGTSPCGRTNMRIKGWMGRADQTTKVKGMFVHPEQVAEVAKRHAGIGRLRLVVGRAGEQDTMTLKAEAASPDAGLKARLADTLQSLTKLKGDVELVTPGSLPNDGKVIADERTYG